ncbi:MAG: hypothetical protein PF795_03185 [Kiritimatiellae bacterium]|jgi:hypothetical protein|nr:hypothetical protein [Kiritimatiellia bacterium]
MSNRLTYTSTSETPAWTRLALPAALLFAAIALLRVTDPATVPLTDQIAFPLQTVVCLILIALSAWLNQQTLPKKAPEGTKACATAIGGPLVLIILFPYLQMLSLASLIGSGLMLAGWLFFLNAQNRSFVWMLASGLCGGLAVSLDPMTVSGLIPLALWNVIRISRKPKTQLRLGLLWLLALTVGFAPLFLGTIPLPAPYFASFIPAPLSHSLGKVLQNLPIAAYPFLLTGLLIACLQKQPVVLGLLLGTFLLRLVLTGFRPIQGHAVDPGLLLPAAWVTAYGVLRVMRGIEQGIRNVNSAKAKRFPAAATLVCLLACGVWVLCLYIPWE